MSRGRITPGYLAKQRDLPSVILMSVLKAYGKNKCALFCFFEGEDRKYYLSRISTIIQNRATENYNCNGKDNILAIYEKIKTNLSLKDLIAAFFVDRDYDTDIENLDPNVCYLTTGYSVENYYNRSSVIKSFVEIEMFADRLHLPEVRASIESIVQTFSARQTEFQGATRLFNKWAWVQKRRYRGQGRINLNQPAFSELATVRLDAVTQTYSLDDLTNACPRRPTPTDEELAEAERWFADRDPTLAHRGKQEALFVYEFLQQLVASVDKVGSQFYGLPKPSCRISKRDFIGDMSKHAVTTPNLLEFLRRKVAQIDGRAATAGET